MIQKIFLALFIGILLLPQAWGNNDTRTLAQLMHEYNSLYAPTEREKNISQFMVNPMIQQGIQESPDTLLPILAKANYDQTQIAIIKKQRLMGAILEQGVLEIRSQDELANLLLGGSHKNLKNGLAIQEISNIETVYKVIFLLMQREEPFKILALNILPLEGIQYPSTDSFSRGLARFAAESAVDAKKFDQVLTLLESVKDFIAQNKQPILTSDTGKVNLASISSELVNTGYNPAFGDPQKKQIIIKNMFAQIKKRPADSSIRLDLLVALASIPDQPDIAAFTKEILEKSQNTQEIDAVIRGLPKGNVSSGIKIYRAISRLQNFPPAESKSLANAVSYFFAPFYGEEMPQVAKRLMPLAKNLYSHPSPIVRAASVSSLRWDGFDLSFRQDQLLKFLNDKDMHVRDAAVSVITVYMNPLDTYVFDQKLIEMSKSEPNEGLRKYIAKDIGKIEASRQRRLEALRAACQNLFN